MISDAVFDYCLSLLEENYKQKPGTRILGVWRTYLNEHLTDEELAASVTHAIIHSRFMPVPADLVQYIQGGKEVKAHQEWQMILVASARNNNPEYLSSRGMVALQAIGGIQVVGLAEEPRRNQLEKSFVSIYCQCVDRDSRSLPPAPVVEATPLWQQQQQQEVAPMPEYLKTQMEELKQKMFMGKSN